MLLLLACAPARVPAPGPGRAADDTGAPAAQSDPGWTIGDEEPCAVPAESVHWTDASDRLAPGVEMGPTVNGPISLAWIDGRWWISALAGQPGVAWWTLDGTTGGAYLRGLPPARAGLLDLDGDGAVDLFTNGDTVEVAWAFGTAAETWETITSNDGLCIGLEDVGVFDADGDGTEDLFYAPSGLGCGDDGSGANPGQVLLNTGSRGFAAPTVIDAPTTFWGATFETAVLDLDGDLAPDIYLCNDYGPEVAPNGLLRNDGHGGFAPAAIPGADIATYCMTASFADLDGDGALDIYVGGVVDQFALDAVDDGFVDAAQAWGFTQFSEGQMVWGSAGVDADNDGLVDVLVTTSDFTEADATPYPMLIEHQVSPGAWNLEGPDWGLPAETGSRGLLARDVNGDGVVDLLAADFGRAPWVLLSDGCTAASWVEVSAPAGTVVTVEGGGRSWTALATDHPGFGAMGPSVAHIGLGDVETIDRVTAVVPWVGERVLVGPLSARRRIAWAG